MLICEAHYCTYLGPGSPNPSFCYVFGMVSIERGQKEEEFHPNCTGSQRCVEVESYRDQHSVGIAKI